jgi:hypothetical protein
MLDHIAFSCRKTDEAMAIRLPEGRVCDVATESKKRGDPFPDERGREGKESRIGKCYLLPRYLAYGLMICS